MTTVRFRRAAPAQTGGKLFLTVRKDGQATVYFRQKRQSKAFPRERERRKTRGIVHKFFKLNGGM